MKTMTLIASLFLTASVSLAAEVDYPETSPIKVTIEKSATDPYNYHYNLYDSKGAVRLVFDRNGAFYIYRNSSGTNSIQKQITEADYEKIMPLVRNASENCPVHFTFARPSFEISTVSSPCDPMEFAQQ